MIKVAFHLKQHNIRIFSSMLKMRINNYLIFGDSLKAVSVRKMKINSNFNFKKY